MASAAPRSMILNESPTACDPVVQADPLDAQIPSWSETLVRETRELMAAVLPLEAHEREFLERLNGAGDIAPELLTAEPALQAIIRDHPGIMWKALNVKRRLGAAAGDEEPAE